MSGHTPHTHRERKKNARKVKEYNVYTVKQTKSHKAKETTPCSGNHTIYEHNTRQRWFGWCFPDKQIPFAINNPAAGKRDRPNECSINQEDVRLPPTSYIHSPTLLFHLFPSLEFLFCLSGKQCVLDRHGEQDIRGRVKKQADQRHGCPLCCRYILSVTSSLSDTQLTCG